MELKIFWVHGFICTIIFLFSYFLISYRKIWYFIAGVYAISIILLVVYLIIFRMTGSGFNQAALYYILNSSWTDILLLTAYKGFSWAVASLLIGVFLFIYFVHKLSLPRLIKISIPSQLFLALTGAGFGLYMTPLVADVSEVINLSGMDKKDSIGLGQVLKDVDIPHPLPGEQKNLIVIYAESMEASFFNEKFFPGLLPKLNSLIKRGVQFSHIEQAPMSNWTIAGMIATQCGVPLSSHRLRNEPNNFGRFSKGHYCLSNYLELQQYKRIYMGGANKEFAGKDDYYEAMNFQEILGLEQLRKKDSPQSKWGLYDDELLSIVKRKIESLRKEKRFPFALFSLTLDSHPPQGFSSPVCDELKIKYGSGENLHLNSIHCNDMLLASFIEKVIEENIHDSTIVMLSDHIMMNSDATVELEKKSAVRRNHMVIWDRGMKPEVIDRVANQFDVAPTILQVLFGKSLKIGFGKSILDKSSENLTELYGVDRLDESVQAWRTESWRKW